MALTFRRQAFLAAVAEAWPLWLAIGGIGVATALAYILAQDLEHQVLYVGVALEIFGIISVAIGVGDVRRSFGRPPLAAELRSWFAQLRGAFVAPQPITGHALATVSAVAMLGRLRAQVRAGQGSPIERRVELLEQAVDQLWNEIDHQAKEANQAVVRVESEIHRERDERVLQFQELSRKTEDFAVGGVRLELVGIVWLSIGCVAAGVNKEVTAILAQLRSFF